MFSKAAIVPVLHCAVLKFYNRKIFIGSKTAPSKMAKAAKSTTLKAKTLIDAMQTLNLIPSFSTSNFGGDVLPENILIKNILGNFLSRKTGYSKNRCLWEFFKNSTAVYFSVKIPTGEVDEYQTVSGQSGF